MPYNLKRLPNPDSNALADLAVMLDAIRHRQRPGLHRTSYLALDKQCAELLERLKQHHPDYYEFRMNHSADPLPQPDSTARFTRIPKDHSRGGCRPRRKGTKNVFSSAAAKLLDDIINDRAITKRGKLQLTLEIPVELGKALLLEARARNVSNRRVATEILLNHYSKRVADDQHPNHC